MNVIEYLNEWDELQSYERDEFVGETINQVVRFLLNNNQQSSQADKDRLKNILIKKSYAKVLTRVVKSRYYDIDLTLATVLSDILVEERADDDQVSELVRDLFLKIIETIITRKTNEICKITRYPRPIVTNLILECPDDLERECVSAGQKYYFINRIINKCYYIPEIVELNELNFDYSDIDRFIRLIKEIIDEENLVKFAINILLEPRTKFNRLEENQIPIWNLLTNVALTIIDDLDVTVQRGTTRKAICNLYIKRREVFAKKSPDKEDVPRRISLITVDRNQYGALGRALEDIENKFEESVIKYLY